MKNLLILIFISGLLAACECEEDVPTVAAPEGLETFMVTNVFNESRTLIIDNPEFPSVTIDYLIIEFNRAIDENSIFNFENFLLRETAAFEYNGEYLVDSNQILIECSSSYYCQSTNPCPFELFLSGEEGFGIRSVDGELLDGDSDGRPGGDFDREVEAGSCLRPTLRVVDVVPAGSTLSTSDVLSTIQFTLTFSESVDLMSLSLDQNIYLEGTTTGERAFLFDPSWNSSNTILNFFADDPFFSACLEDVNCAYRLVVLDDVVSANGEQLDGDSDLMPGGDFAKVYTLE